MNPARNAVKNHSFGARLFRLGMLCLMVTGCAHQTPAPPTIEIIGETIHFKGDITKAAAAEFSRLVATRPVTRLLIHSGGGDVASALDMAVLIRDHAIDVEVEEGCFSSCANYIFPAGNNKYIGENSVVGWHGNVRHLLYLHRTGRQVLNPQVLEDVEKVAAREDEFFRSIGLDGFLEWFGKIPPYNTRNIYLLSVQDMEKFGITNIHASADYTLTDLSKLNKRIILVDVKFIQVDWTAMDALRTASELKTMPMPI